MTKNKPVPPIDIKPEDHGDVKSGIANRQQEGEVPHSLPYDHNAVRNSNARSGLLKKIK